MEFYNETIRIAVNLYARNEKEGEEKYGHINTWNVSGVTNMGALFGFAKSFNQLLNKWDVGNIIHMEWMFCNALSFNQPLDNWNVSNVITMIKMFKYAQSFNQPLSNWNVGKVTNMDDMGYMFDNTTIGEMLKKHNLTNKEFFESPINKKVYHDTSLVIYKIDYII